jgi:hypothetical protein
MEILIFCGLGILAWFVLEAIAWVRKTGDIAFELERLGIDSDVAWDISWDFPSELKAKHSAESIAELLYQEALSEEARRIRNGRY